MTGTTHLLAIVRLYFPSFHGLVAIVTAIPCTPSVVTVVIAIAIALVISCSTGFSGVLRARGTAKVRQLQRLSDKVFKTVLAGGTVSFDFFQSGCTVTVHART